VKTEGVRYHIGMPRLLCLLSLFSVLAFGGPQIEIKYSNSVSTDFSETFSETTKGTFVPEESSENRVVIRFDVHDPGKLANFIVFGGRKSSMHAKKVVLEGDAAKHAFPLLNGSVQFLEVGRSTNEVGGEPLPGGSSFGLASKISLRVSEKNFSVGPPLTPTEAILETALFDAGTTAPRNSDYTGPKKIDLNSARAGNFAKSVTDIGISRSKVGIKRADGAIVPFTVLGISSTGRALGFFEGDVKTRGQGKALRIYQFPLEALRIPKLAAEYAAWEKSQNLTPRQAINRPISPYEGEEKVNQWVAANRELTNQNQLDAAYYGLAPFPDDKMAEYERNGDPGILRGVVDLEAVGEFDECRVFEGMAKRCLSVQCHAGRR